MGMREGHESSDVGSRDVLVPKLPRLGLSVYDWGVGDLTPGQRLAFWQERAQWLVKAEVAVGFLVGPPALWACGGRDPSSEVEGVKEVSLLTRSNDDVVVGEVV